MNVFTPNEREEHMHATTQLLQSLREIGDVENGFQFTFPNERNILTRLVEFISKERMCCPFLEFTLKIVPNHESVSLTLNGPEGTREFLLEEFSEAFA
jgi:hypothetical protein